MFGAFDLLPWNEWQSRDVRTRCFWAVFFVAHCWLMLGSGLNLFTSGRIDMLGLRLHLLAGASFLVALAIYSVALPLWWMTKPR